MKTALLITLDAAIAWILLVGYEKVSGSAIPSKALWAALIAIFIVIVRAVNGAVNESRQLRFYVFTLQHEMRALREQMPEADTAIAEYLRRRPLLSSLTPDNFFRYQGEGEALLTDREIDP